MKTTGSVQEKNGRFYFALNLYDANGKRKIKWISTGLTVRGNKRKAESMLGCCTKRTNKFMPNRIPGVGSPSVL